MLKRKDHWSSRLIEKSYTQLGRLKNAIHCHGVERIVSITRYPIAAGEEVSLEDIGYVPK